MVLLVNSWATRSPNHQMSYMADLSSTCNIVWNLNSGTGYKKHIHVFYSKLRLICYHHFEEGTSKLTLLICIHNQFVSCLTRVIHKYSVWTVRNIRQSTECSAPSWILVEKVTPFCVSGKLENQDVMVIHWFVIFEYYNTIRTTSCIII